MKPEIGETYKMDFGEIELFEMTVVDIVEGKFLGIFPITYVFLRGGDFNHVKARLRLGYFWRKVVE